MAQFNQSESSKRKPIWERQYGNRFETKSAVITLKIRIDLILMNYVEWSKANIHREENFECL